MNKSLLPFAKYAADKMFAPTEREFETLTSTSYIWSDGYGTFDPYKNIHEFAWLTKAVFEHEQLRSDFWIDIGRERELISYKLGVENLNKSLLCETDLTTFLLKALPVLDNVTIEDE